MAEGNVQGVIAAKAAPESDKVPVTVLLADERDDFMDEVIVVLHVTGYAPARRDVAVVPALHVHRIDAEELQVAGFDAAPYLGHHIAVFEFVEAAAGGGKHQHRQAGVAEDQQLHVAAEAGRKPLVIFAIHLWLKVSLESGEETAGPSLCSG